MASPHTWRPDGRTDWRPLWLNDHPAHWRPGTLRHAALGEAAQALAAQPGFAAIAQRFAGCWLATQHANPALRAVFRNTPRYMMLIASLVLHHQRDHNDPRSGLTQARLRSFFEQLQGSPLQAGETQVKAMLAHARLAGLLDAGDASTARGDARYRPLAPTPLMNHIFEQWIGGFLQAMQGVESLALPAPWGHIVALPGLVPEVFSYRLAALREERFVLLQLVSQALGWVLRHDHGYRVFLHCVQQLQPLPDGSALIETSASALAAQAGVARGTVRNLLLDGESQGWFEAVGHNPRLRRWPAEHMRTALLWIALELEWMHGLVSAAWARLGSYRD